MEQYLQIPDARRAPLRELAQEMELTNDPNTIAAAVRNWAVYDLNTPRLPEGKDFVLYFLQESRQGYCVHFSSAAVMLLRTMGIPARYVTGYAVSSGTGQWVTVTDDDAHAWAEYYVDGIGWIPLDATPAAGLPYTPNADSTTAPQEETTQTFAPAAPEEPQQAEPAPPEVSGSASSAAPQPQAGAAAGNPASLWYLLLIVPLLLLILLLRRHALLYRRKRLCNRGRPNLRLLAWWRQLIRLAKIDGQPISAELIQLAEKARFSQHQADETEINKIAQDVLRREEALRGADRPLKRIWRQLISILY